MGTNDTIKHQVKNHLYNFLRWGMMIVKLVALLSEYDLRKYEDEKVTGGYCSLARLASEQPK